MDNTRTNTLIKVKIKNYGFIYGFTNEFLASKLKEYYYFY